MKKRLDICMVERGLVGSREKARALILAGEVLVDDVPFTKAGTAISEDSQIRIKSPLSKYVSRGGDKLQGALSDFSIEVRDLVCIDIGSSTGGFTDCLLQSGARSVYCIDVGTNQLDHKLRVDPRVRVFEKTHVKDLHKISFDPVPTFCVIDVSFIGLDKVLPHVLSILSSNDLILMLVKPQFELGQELIGKNGVPIQGVDPFDAVRNLRAHFSELGLAEVSSAPSHILGKKSENQEYFLLAKKA